MKSNVKKHAKLTQNRRKQIKHETKHKITAKNHLEVISKTCKNSLKTCTLHRKKKQ